jgi:Zn-dependent protease
LAEAQCANCGSTLPRQALSCPSCHRLVHAARLAELAQQAGALEAANPSEALRLWRDALALLPPDVKQAEAIRTKIAELSARTASVKPEPPAWAKRLGPIGAVLVLALTKGKFLLLGLGKIKTLGTMLASMGLYWSLYGWRFAVGFILGIYIHEMGHVWALRHFGLRASVPMFIPGLGAIVSLYDSPANVHEDATIGLAGPIWGTAAGIGFALIGYETGSFIWFAIAHATVLINLFNLTPVWQLDGGRGFRALDFQQRLMLGGLFVLLWLLTSQGIFLFLIAGAAYRLFWLKDHAPEGDQTILTQFGLLAAILGGMLAVIPIPR